jgi:hypothetical protein
VLKLQALLSYCQREHHLHPQSRLVCSVDFPSHPLASWMLTKWICQRWMPVDNKGYAIDTGRSRGSQLSGSYKAARAKRHEAGALKAHLEEHALGGCKGCQRIPLQVLASVAGDENDEQLLFTEYAWVFVLAFFGPLIKSTPCTQQLWAVWAADDSAAEQLREAWRAACRPCMTSCCSVDCAVPFLSSNHIKPWLYVVLLGPYPKDVVVR